LDSHAFLVSDAKRPVDWPFVMAALRQVGYDGWVTAEMIPPVPFYKHAPEVLIPNTARAMDAILGL